MIAWFLGGLAVARENYDIALICYLIDDNCEVNRKFGNSLGDVYLYIGCLHFIIYISIEQNLLFDLNKWMFTTLKAHFGPQ